MLFMVNERFKGRDPAPIYARLREQGRGLPEGLRFVDSWVEANFDRCFQLMECDDPLTLSGWVLQWRDLVEFEAVFPGITIYSSLKIFAPKRGTQLRGTTRCNSRKNLLNRRGTTRPPPRSSALSASATTCRGSCKPPGSFRAP